MVSYLPRVNLRRTKVKSSKPPKTSIKGVITVTYEEVVHVRRDEGFIL